MYYNFCLLSVIQCYFLSPSVTTIVVQHDRQVMPVYITIYLLSGSLSVVVCRQLLVCYSHSLPSVVSLSVFVNVDCSDSGRSSVVVCHHPSMSVIVFLHLLSLEMR